MYNYGRYPYPVSDRIRRRIWAEYDNNIKEFDNKILLIKRKYFNTNLPLRICLSSIINKSECVGEIKIEMWNKAISEIVS